MDESGLYNIIYISASRKLMDETELLDLLIQSRAYNTEHHITGMLLYCDGAFIQVLEGGKDEVNALFNTIRRDERHRMISIIKQGPISQRCFSEWNMGFKSYSKSDLEQIEGYSSFLSSNINSDEQQKGIAYKLLESFKDTSCR